MPLVYVFLVLESIPLLALLDCFGRDSAQFRRGVDDRRDWLVWLCVAVATAWLLVGNGIVLGYYYAVVRPSTARY